MDEYAEIYWLDERNASRDHRRPGSGGPSSAWRPGTPPPGARPAPAAVPVIRYPAQHVMSQPVMAHPVAVMQPQQPTYFGSLGLTLGQIIDIAAQVLAAFQPLPAAPVATSEVEKDVGNLVLYQTAIAQHAKRDEQLRTIGSLISKLVK
jgi:hypothetical protein